MKLFIAAHFLILSFAALGVGIWKDQWVIGVIAFIILQAIAFLIVLKNKSKEAEDV